MYIHPAYHSSLKHTTHITHTHTHTHTYTHTHDICMYILTTFIYDSVLTIKPHDIISSTLEDITIVCISYCDSRNISSSWIKWPVTEPLNGYWRCSINNITINYDIISSINIYRCSYFNCLVPSCDNRWSWYIGSFINVWWI